MHLVYVYCVQWLICTKSVACTLRWSWEHFHILLFNVVQFNEIILLSLNIYGFIFYFIFFLFTFPTFVRMLALCKSLFFWAKLFAVRRKLVHCWRLIHKKCKLYAILQTELTHNVFLSVFFFFIGFKFRRAVLCMWFMVAYKNQTAEKNEDAKKIETVDAKEKKKKSLFVYTISLLVIYKQSFK